MIKSFVYGNSVNNLFISQQKNVVSDKHQIKPIEAGTYILNYATINENQRLVQVGLSTGNIKDVPATEYWEDYDANNVVYEVEWLTDIVSVDWDIFLGQAQMKPSEEACENVIQHLRDNNYLA